MRDMEELFAALGRSGFRRGFQLKIKESQYLRDKGVDVVLAHARDFIRQRIAPAIIANDGKQTPFRGHPVFIAQHATACCCRGCLEKWHRIPQGRALEPIEEQYLLEVVGRWLRMQQNQ